MHFFSINTYYTYLPSNATCRGPRLYRGASRLSVLVTHDQSADATMQSGISMDMNANVYYLLSIIDQMIKINSHRHLMIYMLCSIH